LIFKNGRKIFGVSYKQIIDFGAKLSGNVTRDWFLLFAMNALPFFPAAFISIASGFIKVNFTLFITATFLGTLINSIFYLYLGYSGFQALSNLGGIELGLQAFGIILAVVFIAWLLKQYNSNK
jgi:uncharacterized membrane protein YdjX (TVP38/TMEM64 family)